MALGGVAFDVHSGADLELGQRRPRRYAVRRVRARLELSIT